LLVMLVDCGQIGEQIGGQFHLRNMHC
jgi:hypothetical protein